MLPLRSSSCTPRRTGKTLWNDNGRLYAFVSDDLAVNDYGDVPREGNIGFSGHFIEVPAP